MEVVGVVKDGKVELPASVHLAEGAEVRVIVAPEALAAAQPFESEPIAEANVLDDIAWVTGHRFDSIRDRRRRRRSDPPPSLDQVSGVGLTADAHSRRRASLD